ncbi:FGFR1 oncogene partner 2 homolog [Watersipora subatra]|uniref:FGFR1 oncogene partner 2 homolog n=1 Tax=Watersipora subatra TaxID=2589382 RepID=UPI00355B1528
MFSLENLISDARLLGSRLRENESYADSLISQASNIQERLTAMKQYEEDLNKLNDIPKRKPRQKLILEIAQESKQIRELKTENLELKACLDEHQTTLELVMNKYREQMRQFMMTKKLEDSILKVLEANNCSEGIMQEKICEMVSVMRHAATVDDAVADQDHEKVTQLLIENKGLKEMLQIHKRFGAQPKVELSTSAEAEPSEPIAKEEVTPEVSDGEQSSSDCDDSVVEMESNFTATAHITLKPE